VFLWVVAVFLYLMAGAGLNIVSLIDPITYSVATFGIYSFIILFFYQRAVFLDLSSAVPEPVVAISTQEVEHKKYQKSGMDTDELERNFARLGRLMADEKPYRDSELTLLSLATKLSLSPHHLSQLLNERVGKNFYDYINEYRVDEVKRELVNPQKSNFTILAIALECGFNSKSTFNTCFKKNTGLTPSQYRVQKIPQN
jgi:AraC-like DNA-binding protein